MSHRGDWMCTLCRPDQGAAGAYDCESSRSLRGVHALYTLSPQEQRVSFSEGFSRPVFSFANVPMADLTRALGPFGRAGVTPVSQ